MIGGSLGEATVSIRATLDQYEADLARARASSERAANQMQAGFERVEQKTGRMSRAFQVARGSIALLATAGAAAGSALLAFTLRAVAAGDAVGKTAAKIGITTEALQELRFAAQRAGIEQRTLDMALQRFTRRAAEAAQGTGEAKAALAQMGVVLRDQNGNMRRTEDLLGDVADAFARIGDPAERVRLAFKLFDSEGVAMVNMLRGGSAALAEMRQRARDLGGVLSEQTVRSAEEAADAMLDLKAASGALGNELAGRLIPLLTAVLKGWMDIFQLNADQELRNLTKQTSDLNDELGEQLSILERMREQGREGSAFPGIFDPD